MNAINEFLFCPVHGIIHWLPVIVPAAIGLARRFTSFLAKVKFPVV